MKFPKNQIKYILEKEWDESNRLESSIKNFFYNNSKITLPTKTDDLILLYSLGIDNTAKKQFIVKFEAWKKTRDKTMTEELLKLFFLSFLNNGKILEKSIKEFLNVTSSSYFDKDFIGIYLFLKHQYLNEEVKIEKGDSVISMIAYLFHCYEKNKVREFYETQIELIDLISKRKINTYDKIGLLLYSENEKFRGMQLNRRDSLNYLKINEYSLFYIFIKEKFLSSLKSKIWFVSVIIGLFMILRIFGLLNFSQVYDGDFFNISLIPLLIDWISIPKNLFILFLISIILEIIISNYKFLNELKRQ